jgi:hypothetical protein
MDKARVLHLARRVEVVHHKQMKRTYTYGDLSVLYDNKKFHSNSLERLNSKLNLLPKPLPNPGTSVDVLSANTPHERDLSIKFDEGPHTYYVDWDSNSGKYSSSNNISASTLIHRYFPKFDTEKAICCLKKGRAWNATHGLWGMSDKHIKQLWKENGRNACLCGTMFHLAVESHMNGTFALEKSISHKDNPAIMQYLHWRETYFVAEGFVPFRTELRMRTDREHKVVGTADLIAVKDNHAPPEETGGVLTLSIFDWKNSKEIKYANKYETGYEPCEKLDNCNFVHYSLQQSLYKHLLETYYGRWVWRGHVYTSVKIDLLQLVVCHENYGTMPVIVPLAYDPTVEQILLLRKAELEKLQQSPAYVERYDVVPTSAC